MALKRCTFLLLYLIASALAALVNVTVDDDTGDSITGDLPIYVPADGWSQGATCTFCAIKPDASLAFDGTWHDTTHSPDDPEPREIHISFTGTAVYAFFIVPNSVLPASTGVVTTTNMTFTLDGALAGAFVHSPSSSMDILYNVSGFVKTDLENTQHQLIINATGDEPSVSLFDYLVYTMDTGPENVPLDPASSAPPTPPPPDPLTPASPTPSPSRHPNIGIIVGVVSGVVFITILVIVILLYRRRRKAHVHSESASDSDKEMVVEPFQNNGGSIYESSLHTKLQKSRLGGNPDALLLQIQRGEETPESYSQSSADYYRDAELGRHLATMPVQRKAIGLRTDRVPVSVDVTSGSENQDSISLVTGLTEEQNGEGSEYKSRIVATIALLQADVERLKSQQDHLPSDGPPPRYDDDGQ